MDRDDLVKFAHHQPRVGVREERGEGLCECRVGEFSDRVGMLSDHSFQVRAEALSVGGAAEPGGLQAASVCVQSVGCQILLALRTYDCAVFTVSQG